MRFLTSTFVCAAVLASAGTAAAQGWNWGDSDHGFVSLNGIYQPTAVTFSSASPLDVNRETGTVRTDHRIAPGPALDVTAGGRVYKSFGIGYAVTYAQQTETGSITADVPHPFYFNQFRVVTGQNGLKSQNIGLHLSAMYFVPASSSVQVVVFGGPSFFITHQEMVSAIDVSDSYPFDTAQFVSATVVREDASHLGYNAGVDVAKFFTKSVGIGGLVRYTRAKLDIPAPNGGTASENAGGVQAGVGVRLRF